MQGFIPLCVPVYDFFSKIKFVDFFKIFLNQELTFFKATSISAGHKPSLKRSYKLLQMWTRWYREPDSRF